MTTRIPIPNLPNPDHPADQHGIRQIVPDPYDCVGDENPDILPFIRRTPGPLEVWERVFVVDGRPIQLIAERWRDADAGSCPYPLCPDPCRPGRSVAIQLTSLTTGVSSYPLHPDRVEELRRLRCDPRSGALGRN